MPIKIVAISDTHTKHRQISLPDGDMIICAGDISYRGTIREVNDFLEWYSSLPYKEKILIAGNHDWGFEREPELFAKMCKDAGIIYLNDSSYTSIDGFKIWGSPVQPAFCNWAFNRARSEKSAKNPHDRMDFGHELIKPHWDLIPDDVDILITHGPPYKILDQCQNGIRHVGCVELLKKIKQIKPKLHIFGHIHESRGRQISDGTTYINASSLDLNYQTYRVEAELIKLENK